MEILSSQMQEAYVKKNLKKKKYNLSRNVTGRRGEEETGFCGVLWFGGLFVSLLTHVYWSVIP